mgnify:CR=1 FL=1
MDKLTQAQLVAIQAKQTRNLAQERLQTAINTLQRSMYDLGCYSERLDAADNDTERTWVMNSAINHLVCNIQPNLRIDLLAESQAELAVLGA